MYCHLDVLDDNFGEKPDILIPDSSPEVRLGKLVSHLSHHQLNDMFLTYFPFLPQKIKKAANCILQGVRAKVDSGKVLL